MERYQQVCERPGKNHLKETISAKGFAGLRGLYWPIHVYSTSHSELKFHLQICLDILMRAQYRLFLDCQRFLCIVPIII